MDEGNSPISLCERITLALRRNGLSTVSCESDEKGSRLVGSVTKEEDRAVAYALARTTMGAEKMKIINAIEIKP